MNIPTFDEIFKPILYNFWLIGIPAKDKSKERLGLIFAMTSGTLVLMIVGELGFLCSSKNFLEITALAPCTGIGFLSLAKLSCVALKRDKIFELYDSLKKLYDEIIHDKIKKDLVVSEMVTIQRFTRFFYILNGILITVYNFATLIMILFDYVTKGKIVFYLPYSIIVPFSTEVWFNWLIVYIFSITAGFMSVLYFITVDGLYYNLSIHVCCNFTILSKEIEQLKSKNVASLSNFVKKHHFILKLSEDLEDIFRAPNFYNVVVGSIEVCVLGFNLLTGKLTQMPGFILFLLSEILQIFVMSVMGEKLIRESGAVAEKAFLSDWYNMDEKFKKTILLIMTRGRKPQKLTAYKYSIICYESFTKIITTSWSYFTLLRTMYDTSM